MSDATDLQAAVTARIDEATLLQWTKYTDTTATTSDSDKVLLACTDAIAEFSTRGVTYDGDNADHVMLGVKLVKAILQSQMGGVVPNGVQASYASALASIDKLRQMMAIKPGKARGWGSYATRANDDSTRFPNSTMDLVRRRPPNPRNR